MQHLEGILGWDLLAQKCFLRCGSSKGLWKQFSFCMLSHVSTFHQVLGKSSCLRSNFQARRTSWQYLARCVSLDDDRLFFLLTCLNTIIVVPVWMYYLVIGHVQWHLCTPIPILPCMSYAPSTQFEWNDEEVNSVNGRMCGMGCNLVWEGENSQRIEQELIRSFKKLHENTGSIPLFRLVWGRVKLHVLRAFWDLGA